MEQIGGICIKKMKKKIIIGILGLLLIVGLVNAYTPYKFIETYDLSVLDDMIVVDQARFDGTTHLNGGIYVNEHQTFTGTCPQSWDLVIEDGLIVDCVGPSK